MITWGLYGRDFEQKATVYCAHCRSLIAVDVKPSDAPAIAAEANANHQCRQTVGNSLQK